MTDPKAEQASAEVLAIAEVVAHGILCSDAQHNGCGNARLPIARAIDAHTAALRVEIAALRERAESAERAIEAALDSKSATKVLKHRVEELKARAEKAEAERDRAIAERDAERDRCAKLVCRGCSNGLPLTPDDDGGRPDPIYHVIFDEGGDASSAWPCRAVELGILQPDPEQV